METTDQRGGSEADEELLVHKTCDVFFDAFGRHGYKEVDLKELLLPKVLILYI